jgi:hypothetical protein
VTLAGVARLPALGSAELGLEETWSWYLTAEALRTGDLWRSVTLGGLDAPLFDLINVLVAKVAGLSVRGLRGTQALFGLASVALVFVIVRRLRGAAIALPVALLAAWSPFLVFYSKDARPYAQALFFTLAFTWAFEATRRLPLLVRGLALTGATALAVTSHYSTLVYFAAFYAVVLAGHRLAGRSEHFRADLRTGGFTLAATAPLLFPLFFGLGSTAPFWQVSDISLPGIVVEQFLFLGTTLPHGGLTVTVINLVVFGLLVLPFAAALVRRSGLIGSDPLLSSLWWLAPGMVAGVGILVGQDLLFHPRGFISSAPFLFAYWVIFTGALPGPRWTRRLYVVVLIVPFLLSGQLVATSHPGQAYLRGRGGLAEVVRGVAAHREEFDLILIDHWWMAPYFTYFYEDRSRVWALGRDGQGETAAVEDVARLPADARVLLVINDVGANRTDAEGKVVEALRSRRTFLRELPCPEPAVPERGLVCNRMLLFDRVRPPAGAAP